MIHSNALDRTLAYFNSTDMSSQHTDVETSLILATQIKACDPERQRKVAIFDAWWEEYRGKPKPRRNYPTACGKSIEPDGKTREHLAAAVSRLAGTRVGGYTAPCSAIPDDLISAQSRRNGWGLAWQICEVPRESIAEQLS